jgi:pimeloyl-ACP methyl ester carboxylesterase
VDELDGYEVTNDEAEWSLSKRLLDHDPRPGLRRLTVPVLALFGAEDQITPVDVSVEAFREEVRPDLLTVAILRGGDHRAQEGDPPRLVDGYAAALVAFVRAAVHHTGPGGHRAEEGGSSPAA